MVVQIPFNYTNIYSELVEEKEPNIDYLSSRRMINTYKAKMFQRIIQKIIGQLKVEE